MPSPLHKEKPMKPEMKNQTVPQTHPLRARARTRAVCVLLGATLALCATFVPVTHADGGDDAESGDANDWPMFNHDRSGTRFNTAEGALRPSNVSKLHVKWQFSTPAPVSGTPVVADNVVYAGDMSGKFYALKSNGTLLWSTQVFGAITASALVTGTVVVFGDISGNLYGLDKNTGVIVWSFKPDAHPQAAIWGSPTQIGDNVAVGVSSNEETAAGDPTYPCCSSRGSLLLLKPKTGAVIWQTFTVTNAERATGASGATLWSTPTYDSARKLIYVTTGNNFSQPTTGMSDAIIAFDARTGAIRWVNQREPNDEWNFRFPFSPDHPDADFGDSPQVYNLPNGRRVVGAGQKSGFYHVVDATTGALISQNQVEVGGLLGGLFSDTAVANGIVFANGINWPNPGGAAPVAGDLIALSGDGNHELWRFTTASSPDVAGVAVANGVVYFTSSFSQKLYALAAGTGAELVEVQIGTSDSGPAISRGQIYVGTGDAIAVAFGIAASTGSIVALGL
jgi:polyvinyl alcohol dehydrogenase (cytochrome)